ncbi:hypothetical protein [Sphingobium fuliginis]|uniref:hypothetical protein n=1 Tax=Sphingobium fuliginis (strain ATCC 27551) TaxID=336203 RepID=UPI000C0790BB|nr:hypothetical protein [Sphingobium fuliginis]
MKLKYVVTTAALVISSAALGQSVTLSDTQRAAGEEMVRKAGGQLADSLRDTDSTKFREVRLRKTIGRDGKENVMLCGQVNSKNGYGGMSGFHSFMLVADKVWVGGPGQIINADDICFNGPGAYDSRDYTPELRAAFDAKAGG